MLFLARACLLLALSHAVVYFRGKAYHGEDAIELIVCAPVDELALIYADKITADELENIPPSLLEYLSWGPQAITAPVNRQPPPDSARESFKQVESQAAEWSLPQSDPSKITLYDAPEVPGIQPIMKYSYLFAKNFNVAMTFGPIERHFSFQINQLYKHPVVLPLPDMMPSAAESKVRLNFLSNETMSIEEAFFPGHFYFDYDWKMRRSMGVDARLAAWNLLHGVFPSPMEHDLFVEWAIIVLVFQDGFLNQGSPIAQFIQLLCSIPLDFAMVLNKNVKGSWEKAMAPIKDAKQNNQDLWKKLITLSLSRIGNVLIIPEVEIWRITNLTNYKPRRLAAEKQVIVDKLQLTWLKMCSKFMIFTTENLIKKIKKPKGGRKLKKRERAISKGDSTNLVKIKTEPIISSGIINQEETGKAKGVVKSQAKDNILPYFPEDEPPNLDSDWINDLQ